MKRYASGRYSEQNRYGTGSFTEPQFEPGQRRQDAAESVISCNQLKMIAEDGKQRLTDVSTAETLLRLVQSVPSPKAAVQNFLYDYAQESRSNQQ